MNISFSISIPRLILQLILFSCAMSTFLSSAQVSDETQVITPDNRITRAFFGNAVLTTDELVFVGASGDGFDEKGENIIKGAGAVYIFEKRAEGWNELQKLVASDRSAADQFGVSMAVHEEYLVVGANRKKHTQTDEDDLNGAGAAYVFKQAADGRWQEVQKLTASDPGSGDFFGYSVDINGDYIVVGAPLEDQNESNEIPQSGSAYVFRKDENGRWIEIQKIAAEDAGAESYFGNSVSISERWIAIGADLEAEDQTNANTMMAAGAAYIFEKNDNSEWSQVQKLVPTDREAGDFFGWTVAVSDDLCIVGAYQEDEDQSSQNNDAGAVYVFKYEANQEWKAVQKLVDPERKAGANFGSSIDLDGSTIIVGSGSGRIAHIFDSDDQGLWTVTHTSKAASSNKRSLFGCSVAVSDRFFVIGDSGENMDADGKNKMSGAGSATIMEKNK